MPQRITAICPIRNEGPFVVEWVAWYRMLGFTDILMLTNDCTDHSPALLDAMAEAGWITHATHQPRPGKPPKRSAYRTAHAHPLVQAADWIFLCDIDEFLVIHQGDGTVPAYLGGLDEFCRCVAVHWRCFGTSGHENWEDRPTPYRFTRAGPRGHAADTSFKSFVYRPRDFGKFSDHGPVFFDGDWGQRPNVMVDTEGRVLSRYHPTDNRQRATAKDRITHDTAQLNHYITRSEEHFAAKRGTPCATRHFDRYTDAFFETYNRNEVEDLSAMRHQAQFDALLAEAMALPGVARLHHLCCADHVAWLCERSGRDPGADPRRAFHLGRAAAD
ncbi:MAG: glycosyltransferase family 2 protein [Rhodobacter sp.]|nr:glycosyltransferase family 2 protein [Rhodobacter sp.]